MTEIEKQKKKSALATWLGLTTAFVVALSMNDFKAMGYPMVDIVIKALAIALPVAGGTVSKIK